MRINKDGEFEFLAPVGFPLSAAEKLVAQNGSVIERLRKRQQKMERASVVFREGMLIYWYGKLYPVRFSRAARAVTADAVFVPGGDESAIRCGLETLYKYEAKRYLTERTKYLAELFGITVKSVSIGSAASRWGCCKRDGAIRYSWRLIQCPTDLIDYIIIHELAHRLEFNHSPLFWQEVEKMLPDSWQYKRALRAFSRKSGLL